jgi:hypothetical protein
MADAELRVVASAKNEFEADLVCGLLADADIHSMQRGDGIGGQFVGGGTRDVLVNAEDFDRARKVLNAGRSS